jgi:predicted extracellular nuclease
MRAATFIAALALAACDDGASQGRRLPVPEFDAVSARADTGVSDAASPADAAPVEAPPRLRIAQYNVENLFDLVDDPSVDEGEFTPAPGRWDGPRLAARLERMGRTFAAIDADVVSICEIENEDILRQLRDAIADAGGPRYDYVAEAPSRDPRGIDVGLLSRYPIVQQLGRPINVRHDCQGPNGPVTLDGSRPEARPILQVDLNVAGDSRPELTVLVNHWKSKRDGSYPCDDSEHRLRSAAQVVEIVHSILADHPERGIVVTGDFNTYEFEAPFAEVMQAQLDAGAVHGPDGLFDTWGAAPGVIPGRMTNSNVWNNVGNSSYAFHGDWSRLDHLVVNGNLLAEGRSGWRFVPDSVASVHPDFLLDRGVPQAYDAGSGEGYSDHLPVRIELERVGDGQAP